jgi:hypothetical protein
MAMRRDMAATIAEGGRAEPDARALPQFFGALPAPAPPAAAGRLLNDPMENEQAKPPAVPLLVLLVMAAALGVAVAVALAGVAMLLAAPAYAGDGSLLRLTLGAAAAQPALLTRRQTAGLVEPTEALGPGETLIVELIYRTRSVRRVLALRER